MKRHKDAGQSGMATDFASTILKTAKQEAQRRDPTSRDRKRDR